MLATEPNASHSQARKIRKKKRSDLKIAIQHQFPIGPLSMPAPEPTKQQPESEQSKLN